ncbi:MAG: Fur family transcriptional regulator [Oligoflexales bacterium]
MNSKKINSLIHRAEDISSKSGKKLTSTRKQVLIAMLKSNKALSAYELADQVKQEFDRSIPTMSVYRILDVLVDAKLVHKMSLVNKYIACSHISCEHKHMFARFLICKNCHKVKELMTRSSTVKTIKGNMEESGFELINNQVELNCLCTDCAS